MTYKEILDYILKLGYKYFKEDFKLRQIACYYEDESNYRIVGDINDTNVLLDLKKENDSIHNGIMIWGLEHEILGLSKKTIKKAFKLTYKALNKTIFIKCLSKEDEFLSEFSFKSSKDFNEKAINDWYNEYNNLYGSDSKKSDIYKLIVRYPYYSLSKEYIKDENNCFILKH